MARDLERGARWLRLLATAALVGFALHALLPDGGRLSWAFDYLVYYGVVISAALLVIARVALVPVNRAAWTAIALAASAYAGAELLWPLVYAQSETPPYPSWADALYLVFYPASYVGVVLLFRARARGVGPGLWLDGLAAGLTAGAIGAAFLVDLVLTTTEGSFSTVATNLAYPLGDVFILALVVGGFSVTGWRPGRAWVLIGVALALFAVGDSIYVFQTARETYVEGRLLDVSWPAALLLVAWAAWADRGRDGRVDATGRPLLAAPVVCAGLSVGVLLLDRANHVNLLAVALATGALAAVVGRLAVTFRDNRRLLEQARHDAVTDHVTGLGNRRRLVDDLDLALSSGDEPWLLVIFDLDGFKGYNDTFGHPSGDLLLAHLGAKLAAQGDSEVHAYRLGGDEFCLLAPVEGVDVERLIDRAVEALTERGEGFDVTSSFGAVILPEEGARPSDALRLADARLYAQKHGKRARRDQPHRPLLQALLEREPGIHSHTEEVAVLADDVGRVLGLDPNALDELHRAALLHDVGKLAVPDAILFKPGALVDDEWSFIRRHTLVGERILMGSPALRGLGRIVRATHEHWDGSGYPDGLEAEAIPLASRVIGVCDAWDAMTSDRPYRSALSPDLARAELRRCAGTQFDPSVVAALLDVLAMRDAAAVPEELST